MLEKTVHSRPITPFGVIDEIEKIVALGSRDAEVIVTQYATVSSSIRSSLADAERAAGPERDGRQFVAARREAAEGEPGVSVVAIGQKCVAVLLPRPLRY